MRVGSGLWSSPGQRSIPQGEGWQRTQGCAGLAPIIAQHSRESRGKWEVAGQREGASGQQQLPNRCRPMSSALYTSPDCSHLLTVPWGVTAWALPRRHMGAHSMAVAQPGSRTTTEVTRGQRTGGPERPTQPSHTGPPRSEGAVRAGSSGRVPAPRLLGRGSWVSGTAQIDSSGAPPQKSLLQNQD